MSRSPTRRTADGVLLALTGEDAAIVQALDDAGSGLKELGSASCRESV